MPLRPVVARAALHMWEEPCISGGGGSGTVFFSGCSLKCVYCQNGEISHGRFGKLITVERLAEIFGELFKQGAENINLVNPTHYVPAIKEALDIYRPPIPIAYNSGGYDSPECIEAAAEFADIFLMDFKYITPERALRYSGAADYPEVAAAAIMKCAEKVGHNVFDGRGMMKKGLIIRHLVLPGATGEAVKIIDWVNKNAARAVLSLMSQYTPCGDLTGFDEINRRITPREYRKVLDAAENTDIDLIFTQELESGTKDYIPRFDLSGV